MCRRRTYDVHSVEVGDGGVNGVDGKGVSHRDVARWLMRSTRHLSPPIQSVTTSPVWPPYENESGFIVTLEDGSEWEILVRERERS